MRSRLPEKCLKNGKNGKQRCYGLSVWGAAYAVYPGESRISRLSKKMGTDHEYLDLFVVHYLLHAKAVDLRNIWISEKDIPGGAIFFRGPHEIPTDRITKRYGIGDFVKPSLHLNPLARSPQQNSRHHHLLRNHRRLNRMVWLLAGLQGPGRRYRRSCRPQQAHHHRGGRQ